MPLAIDPNATFMIVLDSDKDKIPHPALIYRYLTGRQWRRLCELFDEMKKDKSDFVNLAYQAAAIGFVKLENGPDGLKCESVEDAVGPREIREVVVKMLGQGLNIDDLKNSGSQSPTGTENSAENAKSPATA